MRLSDETEAARRGASSTRSAKGVMRRCDRTVHRNRRDFDADGRGRGGEGEGNGRYRRFVAAKKKRDGEKEREQGKKIEGPAR